MTRICFGGAALLVVGLLTAANALSDEPKADVKAMGTIKSVDNDFTDFNLIIGQGDKQDVKNFEVGNATKFLLNGKPSTAAETLIVGAKATVTHPEDNDMATLVEVNTETKEAP